MRGNWLARIVFMEYMVMLLCWVANLTAHGLLVVARVLTQAAIYLLKKAEEE